MDDGVGVLVLAGGRGDVVQRAVDEGVGRDDDLVADDDGEGNLGADGLACGLGAAGDGGEEIEGDDGPGGNNDRGRGGGCGRGCGRRRRLLGVGREFAEEERGDEDRGEEAVQHVGVLALG